MQPTAEHRDPVVEKQVYSTLMRVLGENLTYSVSTASTRMKLISQKALF